MGWHNNRRCDRAIIACALFVHDGGLWRHDPIPRCRGYWHGHVSERAARWWYRRLPSPRRRLPAPRRWGRSGPDGTFRMKVTDHWGAAVGSHKVTVDYRRELTDEEAQNLVIPDLLIPATYARIDANTAAFHGRSGRREHL